VHSKTVFLLFEHQHRKDDKKHNHIVANHVIDGGIIFFKLVLQKNYSIEMKPQYQT